MQVTCRDYFDNNKLYAPSVEEQKGISEALAGRTRQAIQWFDRAIIVDPRRGARAFVFSDPIATRVSMHYGELYQARHDHDLKAHESALANLFFRNPQLTEAQKDRLKGDIDLFSAPPYAEQNALAACASNPKS